MQNLLDYNINKHMRTLTKRPVIKVSKVTFAKSLSDVFIQDSFLLSAKQMGFLGCCGEEVDGIKYYTSMVDSLTREVKRSAQLLLYICYLLLFSSQC